MQAATNSLPHRPARHLSGAVLCALLAIVFRTDAHPSRAEMQFRRLEELAEIVTSRAFAGRLAEPFRYLSPAPVVRSATARTGAPGQVGRIADLAASGDARAPRTLRVSGVARLILGDSDGAAEELFTAARDLGDDPDLWTDASAALLASCDQAHSLERCLDALAAADAALRLQPEASAARFNRALALERLGLLEDARAEWKSCITGEDDERWAAEARMHAARIADRTPSWKDSIEELERAALRGDEASVARLVLAHPQESRTHGESLAMSRWADGHLAGDRQEADRQLAIARSIAAALEQSSGERLLRDTVRLIDSTPEGHDGIAHAYRTYREGRIAHASQRPSEAVGRLRESAARFAEARSPMEYVADYYAASALYAMDRIEDAATQLDALAAARLEERGYHALAAQIGWERGLSHLIGGSYSQGLEILEASASRFAALGERGNVAAIDDFVASGLDLVGSPDEAWEVRATALAALPPERRMVSLNGIADMLSRRGEWIRALAVANVCVATAHRVKNPLHLSSALVGRSEILSRLERTGEARADLEESRRWLAGVPDAFQARRLEAQYALAAAAGGGDPRLTSRLLTEALEYFRGRGMEIFSARTLLERARAYRVAGELRAARDDAHEGLAILERYRRTVSDLNQRAMMFDAADGLFMEAIGLAHMAKNDREAFALAERARGRSLLDFLDRAELRSEDAPGEPLTLEELQSSLAADAALVEYAVLPDRVLTFVVRRDVFRAAVTPVSASELRHVADRCSAAALRGSGVREACADAYELLVARIARDLEGPVAIVPDAMLNGLPFAALYDRGEGRYFGERRALSEAPSATVAVTAARRARAATGRDVLILGGTDFDRRRFPSARRLDHVSSEVEALRRVYPDAAALTGATLTRERMLTAMRNASTIHFAGHALAEERRPLQSRLLIASTREEDDVTASAIASRNLGGTRLIYLSACRSGRAARRPDGVENLALAFLAAGAPTVVAARWDVPDQAAAEIALRFHTAALRTPDAAAALQEALRPAYQQNGDLSSAAAMVVVGGTPDLVK